MSGQTADAAIAHAAADVPSDRHEIPRANGLHSITDVDDLSDRLVSERERSLPRRRALNERSVDVADTCGDGPDDRLSATLKVRRRRFSEREGARVYELQRLHRAHVWT
jgi:hypothetical protein